MFMPIIHFILAYNFQTEYNLCLIGMLSFILFEIFHYEYAYTLSQCFFLIGILYAIVEYLTNKKMLLEKLNRDYINNFYEAVIPLKGVTVFSFLIGRSSPAAGMNYRILGWVYYFEFFVN